MKKRSIMEMVKPDPEFAKIVEKRILAAQHQDGTREGICPICEGKMIWRDLGVAQSVEGMHDYGGVWICKCGYQSDE